MNSAMRFVMTVSLVTGLASGMALGQADAADAYESGKAAFAEGDYQGARDAFARAARTDNRNPEVFLWLGRAHYELGEVGEALEAWQRTLRLSPDEPFAKRMVAALQGVAEDAGTRLALIQGLLDRGLPAPAYEQGRSLLRDEALQDAQRARAMLLQARARLDQGRPDDALALVEQVRQLHADTVPEAELLRVEGEALLAGPSRRHADGLAALEKVIAEHAKTDAAAGAGLALLQWRVAHELDADVAERLAAWVAAHPTHREAWAARTVLVRAHLDLAEREAKPQADAPLGEHEQAAIGAAIAAAGQASAPDKAEPIILTTWRRIQARYAAAGSHAALAAALESLLGAERLPRTVRLTLMVERASVHADLAMAALSERAAAGDLPDGDMPDVLRSALEMCAAVNGQYPAESRGWTCMTNLATRVAALSPEVHWPRKVEQLKAPQRWAADIALAVIGADAGADTPAVKQALAAVTCLAQDVPQQKTNRLAVLRLRRALQQRVVAAVDEDSPHWPDQTAELIQRLHQEATAEFSANIDAGRDDANGELSDTQKAMIDAMRRLLARNQDAGPRLNHLAAHLEPWLARGHGATAEAAYRQLLPALSDSGQTRVRLIIASLWVRQASEQHHRLLAAGRRVPERLDPKHLQAIETAYALQAGLSVDDGLLGQARQVWESVVRHYESLELYDVAEAAVRHEPDVSVDNADAWAAWRLAELRRRAAERELHRTLGQYRGHERIELTRSFEQALAGYRAVITDWPDKGLTDQAVSGVFGVAQLFERHGSHEVAAGLYRQFAAFAEQRPRLVQVPPGGSSIAELARYRAAKALHEHANQALQERLAEREPDTPPPAKLSDLFAAAIDVYKAIITARPDAPLAGTALRRIMDSALAYAEADAWTVAEGIFADLQAAELELRRPERLDLARGICRLGPAMPDHARQVLKALAAPVPPPTPEQPALGLALADGDYAYDGRAMDEDAASPADPARQPGGVQRPESNAGPNAPAGQDLTAQYDAPAAPRDGLAAGEQLAMAAIRQSHQQQASRVAQVRGRLTQVANQADSQTNTGSGPVLSDAELTRWADAFDAAYKTFQAIREADSASPTARQARAEILLMIERWRTVGQWQRAAELTARYLKDNPRDPELPQLHLRAARDYLAWASEPIEHRPSKQEMLAEVAQRFEAARERLAAIVRQFEDEKSIVHQAQWDIATSWLTQARVVHGFSAVLARGQYVRAADELQDVAGRFPEHPRIGQVPDMLWQIAGELASRAFHDEAIEVWTDLTVHYPTHGQAMQARHRIAETYHHQLGRPLKAGEAYMELNFAHAGDDNAQQQIQNTIFGIGSQLKNEKRWVEALHVLESFVATFPAHPRAGEALTMVGQIHQANEAWADAIAAYERVIREFPEGQWVRTAKWAIAECTINLSRWREAMLAYHEYLRAYPNDGQQPEAERRISILKDLARYQALVDEENHDKAFDAQYQIAEIVRDKLSIPVKAIIEYRKVTEHWPDSHLADDALYQVGVTYLSINQTGPARRALRRVAEQYRNSPLADDAMFRVGKSYEAEAQTLASVTRAESLEKAQREAQEVAYSRFTKSRRRLEADVAGRISALKAEGEGKKAELEAARGAAQQNQYNVANVQMFAEQAGQEVAQMTARELADRQDKINAALRQAVDAYAQAAEIAAADKADDALLRMAVIHAEKLDDPEQAMQTYLEIVRQFSGTAVAEDASWRIARHYEREADYDKAIDAYKAFLRNYRRSGRAGEAQFAVAENYEHLDKWVDAMDAYKNYITNFPGGPLVERAKQQINWIEKYRL